MFCWFSDGKLSGLRLCGSGRIWARIGSACELASFRANKEGLTGEVKATTSMYRERMRTCYSSYQTVPGTRPTQSRPNSYCWIRGFSGTVISFKLGNLDLGCGRQQLIPIHWQSKQFHCLHRRQKTEQCLSKYSPQPRQLELSKRRLVACGYPPRCSTRLRDRDR